MGIGGSRNFAESTKASGFSHYKQPRTNSRARMYHRERKLGSWNPRKASWNPRKIVTMLSSFPGFQPSHQKSAFLSRGGRKFRLSTAQGVGNHPAFPTFPTDFAEIRHVLPHVSLISDTSWNPQTGFGPHFSLLLLIGRSREISSRRQARMRGPSGRKFRLSEPFCGGFPRAHGPSGPSNTFVLARFQV